MTVLANSTPVIVVRKEAVGENLRSNLTQVPCIRYPINFEEKSVLAFLDSSNEVNGVHIAFAKELGLFIKLTDVRAWKIDNTTLKIYGIVVAALLLENKANWVRFFEKTFLVANISPKIVRGILFLTLNSADIDFLRRELRWRTYTTKETLLTTRCVELVSKKEFAIATLDPKS